MMEETITLFVSKNSSLILLTFLLIRSLASTLYEVFSHSSFILLVADFGNFLLIFLHLDLNENIIRSCLVHDSAKK